MFYLLTGVDMEKNKEQWNKIYEKKGYNAESDPLIWWMKVEVSKIELEEPKAVIDLDEWR